MVERVVDIFQVVKVLRTQRPGAVPTVVSAAQSISSHLIVIDP